MKTRKPQVSLISCTEDPVETLFACWVQSRPTQYPEIVSWVETVYDSGVVTAKHVKAALEEGLVKEEDLNEVFKKVTAMSIPVSESIHLTWGFTSLPIEWREQAVRKRQWGFWLTSMREFGMDNFVSEGRWAPPVEGAGTPESVKFLEDFMVEIEGAYNKLKELGMPQEIARKVIPACATHNGTMFSTFRTLLDTLSSRSCFIAQIDLWAPVLLGMVESLKEKHPLLGMIVSPPCFDRFSNEYKGCKYKLINENRLTEKDPYAPCPLYVTNELTQSIVDATPKDGVPEEEYWLQKMEQSGVKPQYIKQGQRLLPIWGQVWQRDPFTGKLNK